jgi:exopolysaccharide production protein ExoY
MSMQPYKGSKEVAQKPPVKSFPRYKRVLDLCLVALTFVLWGPLMLLLAIVIKLVSPGPAFFKQTRIGFLGTAFTCFKFRSMHVNSDTKSHHEHVKNLVKEDVPMTKMDELGDRRLIPLGAILRSSGLDELPQLFNVLRGEMSLVGPRPCLPDEYAFFEPTDRERFEALPGLTGLWQVSGKNDTTFAEMVDLDIRYARKQCLWLDVKIMWRTLPVLARQVKQLLLKRIGGPKAAGQALITPKTH